MTTIAQVRKALADAASTSGVEIRDYEPDMPVAGGGWVVRREMDPRMVFGATKNMFPMGIVVLFNRTSGLAQVDALCEPSGLGSMKAAVENGDNWGVTVDYAEVTRISDTNVVELGGAMYLSVEFDIEVVW